MRWTTKFVNGLYSKTKCRACFGGHKFDKATTDCFAPTAKFVSVLIVLCLASMFGWFCTGLDFKQAYLNAPVDEPCYLRAPICMREFDPDGNEYFWKMSKGMLYGHPRGAAAWGDTLAKALRDYGFCQLKTDQCVFIFWADASSFCIVVAHSDDCIFVSNSRALGDKTRGDVLKIFDGKDLGKLDSFCGCEIVHQQGGGLRIRLCHYMENMFRLFDIPPLKPGVKCSMPGVPLKSECPSVPDPGLKKRYLQLTGMLIWCFSHCRLDLAFPVHLVTRVMHSPCSYIRSTITWDLCFNPVPEFTGLKAGLLDFVFYVYCDASHADDPDSSMSSSGYFVFLGPGQDAVLANPLHRRPRRFYLRRQNISARPKLRDKASG